MSEHCMPGSAASAPADPLPRQVDIRRLIGAGVSLAAREPLAQFPRLTEMLETDDGCVEVALRFFVDEQGLRRIDGEVRTTVSVLCQRCLSPMPVPLASAFHVVAVWSEEDAVHMPKYLDPFVVGDGPQDLHPLIEDELIISMPFVSYHERTDCHAGTEWHAGANEDDPATDRKENPFKVLERLKSSR